jgi:class 3 adenylate cyclase
MVTPTRVRARQDHQELSTSITAATLSPALVEWAGAESVTLAIVFTDIVGSTALSEEIRDTPMGEVSRAHFNRSRTLIAENVGYEIKTIGDAFMVAFRSVDKALDYAIALHHGPGDTKIRVRVGIHIGRTQVEDGDAFGREVNFASRVVGAIKDAEIWLSSPAKADIDHLGARRFAGLNWEPHDDIALKGFAGTFRLWSLVFAQSRTRNPDQRELALPEASHPEARQRSVGVGCVK